LSAIVFLLEACAEIDITIAIQLNKRLHLVYHRDCRDPPRDLQNDNSGSPQGCCHLPEPQSSNQSFMLPAEYMMSDLGEVNTCSMNTAK